MLHQTPELLVTSPPLQNPGSLNSLQYTFHFAAILFPSRFLHTRALNSVYTKLSDIY